MAFVRHERAACLCCSETPSPNLLVSTCFWPWQFPPEQGCQGPQHGHGGQGGKALQEPLVLGKCGDPEET